MPVALSTFAMEFEILLGDIKMGCISNISSFHPHTKARRMLQVNYLNNPEILEAPPYLVDYFRKISIVYSELLSSHKVMNEVSDVQITINIPCLPAMRRPTETIRSYNKL